MVITTTGSDQKVYLKDEFGDNTGTFTSVGGITYYAFAKSIDELNKIVIRTSQETITTSGLSGDIYTVADASKFRVGSVKYPVLNASDARIGTVIVTNKPSTTSIKVEKIGSFTLTSGDKIVCEIDSFFQEDFPLELDPNATPYLMIKSESSAVKVLKEVFSGEIKKKS